MLKCRLVLFFAAARAQAPQWHWSFGLTTDALGLYSEEEIVAHGWPSVPVHGLAVTVDCPAPYGSFTAHRVVDHQRAARFFTRASQALIADLQREFEERRRDWR